MMISRRLVTLGLPLTAFGCASAPDAEPPASEVVGMRSVLIVDPARHDPLDPSRQRMWVVDVYYPATAQRRGAGDVYARDAVLLQAMIDGGYYDVAAETLRSWQTLSSPAVGNAQPRRGPRPLILLSPGSGLAAFNYSQLAATLVARGYAVGVIDHPYLGISRLPDGHAMNAADDPVQASEDPSALTPRILEWSGDVTATLDHLHNTPHVAPLDLEHILAIGHSTGGAIALDACTQDGRIDACMNFEGALFGSRAQTAGVAKPVVAIGSRAAGRPRNPGPLGGPILPALSQGGNQSAWYVFVSGGSHMSFSDAPRMMPDTLTRFGGEIFPPERADAIYAGMADAFARAYVTGAGGDAAFEEFLAAQPEIEFQSSGGRRSSERG